MASLKKRASRLLNGRLLGKSWRKFAAHRDRLREIYYRRVIQRSNPLSGSPPWIQIHGDFEALPETKLIHTSLESALSNDGGPADFVREIDGMSGQKYRT